MESDTGREVWPQRLGAVSLAATVSFALVCASVQVLRGDLDWTRAPLSFYLLGEYGAMVKAAYFALGAALVSLGIGYYRALATHARSGAPLLLFVVAGLALGVTALADSNLAPGGDSLEALIHGWAATTAFLCVTVAMMLQALRMRSDAAWRERVAAAFTLACASFAVMWLHALWRDAPRGLTQKAVIVLILAWLSLAAWWLHRHAPQAAQSEPEGGKRP